MKDNGKLVVISGFSGSGKGTVIKALRAQANDHVLSVSMTTREPREGEQHGTDYFFVTNDVFEQEISRGGLLEYAGYVDHYYGTPRAYVEEQLREGMNVLLEIEVQGAAQIKRQFPESILIFIVTPTAAELERRLEGRNSEKPEVVTKRLRQALEEAKCIPEYDYLVINDKVEECASLIDTLIRTEPEICRPDPAFAAKFVQELEQILAGRN